MAERISVNEADVIDFFTRGRRAQGAVDERAVDEKVQEAVSSVTDDLPTLIETYEAEHHFDLVHLVEELGACTDVGAYRALVGALRDRVQSLPT